MDLISRQAAIDAALTFIVEYCGAAFDEDMQKMLCERLDALPYAQPDIKQSAKLLSDFIESCTGGASYLITPDGEELRTDWGYATEGIQLIHDWAERRTDE